MLELSAAQISAAKDGDKTAIAAVLSALAPRIGYAARDAATVGGHLDHSMVDDYTQDASMAVLAALPRFEGESAGELWRYLERYIGEAITVSRREESTRGMVYDLPNHSRHTYERALSKAGGDPELAERMAQDSEVFGVRALSASTAALAKEATQRVDYLDAPSGRGDEGGATLADTLTEDTASFVRPKHMTEDQRRTHDVLSAVRKSSPTQAEVLEYAAGLNGKTVSSGMEHKRTKQGDRWTLRDVHGIAEVMGISAQNVRVSWNNAKKRFAKLWVEAHGAREDVRQTRKLTAKGEALVAAVKADDTHVFVKFHGAYVEFKHINEELDVVCTWTTRSRAAQVGILAQ